MSLPPSLTAYRALIRLAAPIAPYLLKHRARRGKEDTTRLNERLGRPTITRPEQTLVWMHGASVGESLVLASLVDEMSGRDPALRFLVTTGTTTSAELMSKRLPSTAMHQYLPVDTLSAVEGFLSHWRPDLAVFAESEIWPNLIIETARRGTPMALVNARMNARSLQNWRKRPDTARWLLSCFDWIGAADHQTRDGLEDLLGEHVTLAGNLKLEAKPAPPDAHELSRAKVAAAGRPVWLAASTHEGEEARVLDAHTRLLADKPDALLVLAPRHPDRGDAVARMIKQHKMSAVRRSRDDIPTGDHEVWLADTLGEMQIWFHLSPVALICGSLKDGIGGHNPVEATHANSAVLTGPHVASFGDLYAAYRAKGAAQEVSSAEEIANAVLRSWTGQGPQVDTARQVLSRASGGAMASTLEALFELLSARDDDTPDLIPGPHGSRS